MKTLTLAALVVALPVAAVAHDGLTVRDGYARSANPKTAAAFMVIENHKTVDCQFGGVNSDIADKVELHSHQEVDGIMKMGRIEGGILIPAEGEHALQRGGDHIMFMGVKAPLENGQEITVSLDFGDCGVDQVTIPVDNDRAPDAAPPAMDHGTGHGEGHATQGN